MNKLALQLLDYHGWANTQVIKHLSGLPTELFHAEVKNVFSSISHMLGHLASVDKVWYSRIIGKSLNDIGVRRYQTLKEAEESLVNVNNQMKEVVSAKKIDEVIEYQNTKGDLFNNTLLEVVHHVVNHGTYHRGNISSMIRQLGYDGVSTDYIVFLRNQRN
jgi:uncharacterized damage-inducible protein DinB